MDYLDFELEIRDGIGQEYPIAVIKSPAGELHEPEIMHFPFDNQKLEERLKDLKITLLESRGKSRQAFSSEEQSVREFGQELFKALFTGEVRNRYDVSTEKAVQEGKGLRLKLRIQPPKLAALPWEFMYDSRLGDYVSLNADRPFVRYLAVPQSPPPTVNPPLYILGMIANPGDELDVGSEKRHIDKAIEDLQARNQMKLEWLQGQTQRDLKKKMSEGTWNIFHFIGHGGFDRKAGEGFIELINEMDEEYFNWEEIPGNDDGRLIEFLKQNFDIDWVKTAKIEKIDSGKTIKVSLENKSLSLRLNDEKNNMNLKIDDGRAEKFIVKVENGKLNVYSEKKSLYAIELARLLARHKSLRLVVLNSCEGAQGNERNIFSSTAAKLVQRGIPAVLAMQYKISDKAAIKFASAFYEALADGMPVDASVAEARNAISTNTLEWGTPVLYMHSPDGVLFNIQKPAQELPSQIKVPEQILKQIKELVSQFGDAKSASDWNRVIDLGEEILKLDPNHQPVLSKTVTAYKLRGESYAKIGDYDRAITSFHRAIHLDPDNADYYCLRGVSHAKKGEYDRTITEKDRDREYDRAINDFDRAIEINPDNANYYYERGKCRTKKGNLDKAIADFTQAIEKNPNEADYYYSRSLCYANIGDQENENKDFARAIELYPNNANYYFKRGTSYADKGDYDMAIKDFDRAIQLDPNKADYFYSRCLSHTNIGDYDMATKDFEHAIRLDPNKAKQVMTIKTEFHL